MFTWKKVLRIIIYIMLALIAILLLAFKSILFILLMFGYFCIYLPVKYIINKK